jgi:hypothetical protein
MRDLEGIAEINGPRRAELQAERAANAERARIKNLDWRVRVAEAQRNLRHRGPVKRERPPMKLVHYLVEVRARIAKKLAAIKKW